MKKIKDGTYRAKRMDGSGYIYGYHRMRGNYPNAPKGCFICEYGQDNCITPVHRETLRHRVDGKWKKVLFPGVVLINVIEC